jgi:hypothetical protein
MRRVLRRPKKVGFSETDRIGQSDIADPILGGLATKKAAPNGAA